MFGVHAYRVRGDANEAPRLRRNKQGREPQRGFGQRIG
jgi:hypothetical protein